MALVEFQNNTEPYLNAENLNNNFTECNNIVESGSNANGNWIKFSDGTMICYRDFTVNDLALNNAYGSLYQGNRTFNLPQTYISNPAGFCSNFIWGTGASWGTVINTTTSTIYIRGIDALSREAGTNVRISWMTIGKWK